VNRELELDPICWACGEVLDGRCIRCEGPACLACDFCHGCAQVLCEDCNTDPLMMPELFPGDAWPHPQNVG